MMPTPCCDNARIAGIDFSLGADVDAAGRFVKDDHFRVRHQPFRQHHFLLIAAAQVARR